MAVDHFKAGRLAEAGNCCGRVLNRTPRDFHSPHLLGRIRIRQGVFELFFLSAALGTGSFDPNDIAAALEDLVAAELALGHSDAS